MCYVLHSSVHQLVIELQRQKEKERERERVRDRQTDIQREKERDIDKESSKDTQIIMFSRSSNYISFTDIVCWLVHFKRALEHKS